MATTFKWVAALLSRGNVLTTELNALANGGFTVVGPAFDNSVNLDEWMGVEVNLASLTPTAGAYVQIFIVISMDGTNYEDAPSSTNPGSMQLVATISVSTGAGTKRVSTKDLFRIPPGKFKFVLKNQTGVALAATGNTVTAYTTNEQGT
jgi:hypothetical protein